MSQESNSDEAFREAMWFWLAVWCCGLGFAFMTIMAAFALGIHTAPIA